MLRQPWIETPMSPTVSIANASRSRCSIVWVVPLLLLALACNEALAPSPSEQNEPTMRSVISSAPAPIDEWRRRLQAGSVTGGSPDSQALARKLPFSATPSPGSPIQLEGGAFRYLFESADTIQLDGNQLTFLKFRHIIGVNMDMGEFVIVVREWPNGASGSVGSFWGSVSDVSWSEGKLSFDLTTRLREAEDCDACASKVVIQSFRGGLHGVEELRRREVIPTSP